MTAALARVYERLGYDCLWNLSVVRIGKDDDDENGKLIQPDENTASWRNYTKLRSIFDVERSGGNDPVDQFYFPWAYANVQLFAEELQEKTEVWGTPR